MTADARGRLAARTAADYAAGGHRNVFVPDLNDVAAVGNEAAANGTAAVQAAEQAAASLASALAITGGAVGIGQDALQLPRNVELGSAAWLMAEWVLGRHLQQVTATRQIVPLDLGRVLVATGAGLTLTLPVFAETPPLWWVCVKNRTGGNITLARNGANINGVAADLTLADGSVTRIGRLGAAWETF